MNEDLMERYIYAVTRRMGKKQREDVSLELRGLIEDMLTERCGSRSPEEKDLRIVLTELGTPQELYGKYSDDQEKSLIAQPCYSVYKYVLKVVLCAVAGGLTVASLILLTLEPKGILEGAVTWLSILYNGLLSSFAIVTLLFVFFSRRGIPVDKGFNFDDLPPVPKKRQEISQWEFVGGIVMCIAFMVLFLGFPKLLGIYRDGGDLLPVFDIQGIRSGWYFILSFGILGIVREVVKLMERRYNKRVLAVTLTVDVLSAGIAVFWLSGADVFSSGFQTYMDRLFAGESPFLANVMGNFQWFFLGILIIALTMDAIEAVYKTLKE